MQAITIGTFTVTETFTHEESYETACNHRKFQILSGTYDVNVYPPSHQHIGHSLYVVVPNAECIGSYFENRILNHRSAQVDADKGQHSRVSFRLLPYGDTVREHIQSGRLAITDERVTVHRYPSEWAHDGMAFSLTWNQDKEPLSNYAP